MLIKSYCDMFFKLFWIFLSPFVSSLQHFEIAKSEGQFPQEHSVSSTGNSQVSPLASFSFAGGSSLKKVISLSLILNPSFKNQTRRKPRLNHDNDYGHGHKRPKWRQRPTSDQDQSNIKLSCSGQCKYNKLKFGANQNFKQDEVLQITICHNKFNFNFFNFLKLHFM